jgi:hypothetical protein
MTNDVNRRVSWEGASQRAHEVPPPRSATPEPAVGFDVAPGGVGDPPDQQSSRGCDPPICAPRAIVQARRPATDLSM